MGMKGLGAEVAKNLILAGVKGLTMLDHQQVSCFLGWNCCFLGQNESGLGRDGCVLEWGGCVLGWDCPFWGPMGGMEFLSPVANVFLT